MNAALGLPVATESNSIRVSADLGARASIRHGGYLNFRWLSPVPNAAGVVTYISPPHRPDRFTDYEFYDVDDWDGYGALPISRETVESARRFFLQIPLRFDHVDIAPGSDGAIGFEWRLVTGSFVLIDVGPGEVLSARKIDSSGKITSFPPTRVGVGAEGLISQLFQYPFL